MPSLESVLVSQEKDSDECGKAIEPATKVEEVTHIAESNPTKTTESPQQKASTGVRTPQKKVNMISPNSEKSKQPQRKVNQLTLGSFFVARAVHDKPARTKALGPTSTLGSSAAENKEGAVDAPDPDVEEQHLRTPSGKSKSLAKKIDIGAEAVSKSKDNKTDQSTCDTLKRGFEQANLKSNNGEIKDPETPALKKNRQDTDVVSKSIEEKSKHSSVKMKKPAEKLDLRSMLTKQATKVSVKDTIAVKNKAAESQADDKSKAITVIDITTPEKKTQKDPAASNVADESSQQEKSIQSLPEERRALLEKHEDMRKRYERRTEELVEGARGGLEEEDFTFPEPISTTEEGSTDEHFSDNVVANMALIIEGSQIALSKLAKFICEGLEKCHARSWSPEEVTAKIKLMAKRKSYLSFSCVGVDLFEDESEDRMWRWEVISLDILPKSATSNVRKARLARKKLSNQYNATIRLVNSLRDAKKLLSDPSVTNLDSVLAKISSKEEKVLQYEREAEKQRLAKQMKRKKQEEIDLKRKEKEQAAEEKRKEKERKRQEAAQKKQDLEKKKQDAEEAKRKKALEREEREEQRKKELEERKREEEQKHKTLKKQKASFRSFFSAQTDESKCKNETTMTTTCESQKSISNGESDSCQAFDANRFRSLINSEEGRVLNRQLFPSLTPQARRSRKRRTRLVPVSVYVTVASDNVFDAQPFAERRIINVPNRYRYLSFHEDCRPPYHGTWSKKSSVVTGRTPFSKDEKHLDYEVDSEAEWEEGDDDVGEDVEDDDKNQEEEIDDEEGDPSRYNYQDGFCVADDEYLTIDDNVDEETRILYRKKLQSVQGGENVVPDRVAPNMVSIVAPIYGGLPIGRETAVDKSSVEGFGINEAVHLITSHNGVMLADIKICLDAFPPALVEEGDVPVESVPPVPKDDYLKQDMEIFVRFIHHSVHKSKDKLVEELRNKHAAAFSSRAKALRKLDLIAVKKRSGPGVYWEVKKEILQELDLHDLIAKKFEDEPVSKDDYLKQDMEIFVRFIHHSVHKSKDKLVEELRNKHEAAFSSRAKAIRKLDLIAVKKRSGSGSGVYWEVKKEILQELDLLDLIAKKFEDELDNTKEPLKKESNKVSSNQNRTNAKSSTTSKKRKKGADPENSATATKKKAVDNLAASANLMASFLKKGKVKDDKTTKEKRDLAASASFMASFLRKGKDRDVMNKKGSTNESNEVTETEKNIFVGQSSIHNVIDIEKDDKNAKVQIEESNVSTSAEDQRTKGLSKDSNAIVIKS